MDQAERKIRRRSDQEDQTGSADLWLKSVFTKEGSAEPEKILKSHIETHKLITLLCLKQFFIRLNFHKIYININLVHYFLQKNILNISYLIKKFRLRPLLIQNKQNLTYFVCQYKDT